MKLNMGFAAMTFALLVAGSALVAAPGQEYTGRPGDPTQAKVWVQNTPLPVEVRGTQIVTITGTPTVTLPAATVVQAISSRQAWDYRILSIPAGGDALRLLKDEGNDGWEATGVQISDAGKVAVLLKRPR